MTRVLRKYEDYSRREAHDLFSPETIFTPQAGTWGLQGIVPLPKTESSYVFFVTFGRKQGGHEFTEVITADGILTWQSQPKQRVGDKAIRRLILHDEKRERIHLFLRTSSGRPYTYLGVLRYVSHDSTRERPVYFKWQIEDWEISREILKRMDLMLKAP
jgi:hypothetical protein